VLVLIQQQTSGQSGSSRFAELDGLRIHYVTHGEGKEALVFVHGGVGSLNNWKLQMEAFNGKKRLILLDLPGHGLSDKPRVTYSMNLLAQAIDAVLRDAKVDKAVLVGISMGTPVIRQFYRRYPEKTEALVFVDGPLRPLAPTQEIGEEFIAQFRRPDYLEAARRFNAGLMTPKIPAEMREQILNSWAKTPQYVIVSVLEQVILPNSDPAIWKADPIKVPVLGVYTRKDYVPADNEQHLRSLAANTEYHAWDDVGHGIPMEMPLEFNRTLETFLNKIGWLDDETEKDDDLLSAVQQLRHVSGSWSVTTEYLNQDGSVSQSVNGSYQFEFVVPDRVLSGYSDVPQKKQRSAILFYVNEKKKSIEMVSVGGDGKLWIMTGAVGDEVRSTQPFRTTDGKESQLRFTRYNVTPDRFESKMEYTLDGGKTWLPGNHQIFTRQRSK
jgi:pimeloyl-ACP methyl ester carboxylesterase